MCRASISPVSEFNDYFKVTFKASIFQNFLRGWGHAGGHIGDMLSKGLSMLSSAEAANLLGDVGACFPAKFSNLDACNCYFQPYSSQYLDLKYNRTYDYFYHVYV